MLIEKLLSILHNDTEKLRIAALTLLKRLYIGCDLEHMVHSQNDCENSAFGKISVHNYKFGSAQISQLIIPVVK